MATYSDIFIDQGSTFSSVIDVPDTNGLPFNLSSYTARGQIRKTYTSKNVVTFTTSIDLPLEGKVNISLTAGQTRAMKAGRYLYDIEIFNSTGHIFRIREGQVEISPGISEDNGGIELIPDPPTIYEIIDERIDARTIVTDKLLTLSAFEETNFYANSKLNQNLALKAPLDSPVFTGIPIAPTASFNTNNQQIATTQFVRTAINNLIDGAPNVLDTLNELADAIGNDANFSTTIINGLSGKAPLNSPSFTGTVSGITKAMVGLGDVDNTSDLDKPVSTATQTALNAKVDKVSGQGLSDENYTLIEKNKLVGIADGATANSTDAHLLSRANHTGSQSYTTITGLGTLATQSGTFSGSSSGTNTGDQTITLGGDATGSGTALLNVTLASTGVFAGEYNSSATSVTPFTVDIKGRITAVDTPITITPSWNSVTDKPTTVSGYSITDAVDLTSAQTISGVKDFTSSPTVPLIPTASGHAASKAYVDTLSEGLHVHAAVHALLKTPLATTIGGGVTITYSNGTNGVGAKLTASAPVTWTTVFNDSDIANDSRVIIAGQSTSAHNGIYVVSSSTELIRADDFNTPTEMAGGDFVFVTHGTYADTGWVLSEPVTEVGVSPVIFTQFSGAGAYEAGAGLFRDGTTFSVVAGTGIAVDGSVSLSTVGSPGTYRSVSVDAYGRVTSGSNPTTLSGYGITDAATSTALSNHISDATVHLTSTQNTLLDGITVTAEKVNYLSDVTSNIQSQLDGKSASGHTHSDATTSVSGFLSANDKSKLDNIPAGVNYGVVNPAFGAGFGTGVANINWQVGTYWSGSPGFTGGTYIQFQNVIPGKIIILEITGTGYAIAWPTGITWLAGSAPSLPGVGQTKIIRILATSSTTFAATVDTKLSSSANYSDLVNVPTTFPPSNHSHDIVGTQSYTAGFMSYSDKVKLDAIAEGAEANVNADWNAISGDAQILNKPTTLSGYGITDALNISATAQTKDGNLTAASFIKLNGLSTEFLKADGTTQQLITGKTLYVDAVTGTDIRGPNSDYSLSSPFATIGEAVSASEDGDLVYVRAGSYTISSPISLNGKGNIYFETAALITIAGTVVAFSLTANETKTVNGFAQFALSNTAGILTQSNGTLFLEYQGIMSASTDTLFRVSGGTLNTSFAGIVAPTTDGFMLTGSGTLVIRRSHTASCKQFLNCNTSGAVTMDIWTVVGTSTDATIRIVNHDGFSYRGVNLNNNSSSPCIVFAYAGGTSSPVLRNLRLITSGTGISIDTATATRNIFLDQIKINAANSLSATAPITVYSTTTYSTVAPDANVTVDGQYNIMSNLF
jgi:hypothetical protein